MTEIAAQDARRRAKSLIDLRRYRDALAILEQALAVAPDDTELLLTAALAHHRLGEHERALTLAGRVVALAPEHEWAHRICALALERLGRGSEALRAAEEAVRLAPFQWQSHVTYAQVAADLTGYQWQALQAAHRAVELAPNEPGAHFTLGVVSGIRNDVKTARAAYERTLALDPEHANARNNLTVLNGGASVWRRARGFASALRSDPQNALIQENLSGVIGQVVLTCGFIFYAGLVVVVIVQYQRSPDLTTARATPASIAIAITTAVVAASYAVFVWSGLPVSVRRFSREMFRAPSGNTIFLAACAAVSLGGLVLASAVPGGAVVGGVLVRITGWLFVGGLVRWVWRKMNR